MQIVVYLPVEALKARKSTVLPGQQAFDFGTPAPAGQSPAARGLHLEQKQVGGHTQGVWVAPVRFKPHDVVRIDREDREASTPHIVGVVSRMYDDGSMSIRAAGRDVYAEPHEVTHASHQQHADYLTAAEDGVKGTRNAHRSSAAELRRGVTTQTQKGVIAHRVHTIDKWTQQDRDRLKEIDQQQVSARSSAAGERERNMSHALALAEAVSAAKPRIYASTHPDIARTIQSAFDHPDVQAARKGAEASYRAAHSAWDSGASNAAHLTAVANDTLAHANALEKSLLPEWMRQ